MAPSDCIQRNRARGCGLRRVAYHVAAGHRFERWWTIDGRSIFRTTTYPTNEGSRGGEKGSFPAVQSRRTTTPTLGHPKSPPAAGHLSGAGWAGCPVRRQAWPPWRPLGLAISWGRTSMDRDRERETHAQSAAARAIPRAVNQSLSFAISPSSALRQTRIDVTRSRVATTTRSPASSMSNCARHCSAAPDNGAFNSRTVDAASRSSERSSLARSANRFPRISDRQNTLVSWPSSQSSNLNRNTVPQVSHPVNPSVGPS